jgi:16S rRNA (guanine966-N2)-methyltransferase
VSVSILGGKMNNFKLNVAKGDSLRPTAVTLKRRIFDSYQSLEGRIFVDLCAGTGSIGLEALSRGAERVYLNELSPKTFSNLKLNIESLEKRYGPQNIKLSKSKCETWIKRFLLDYDHFSAEKKINTIIFIDPPYVNKEAYLEVLQEITEIYSSFVGEIWIESDRQKGYNVDYWKSKNLPVSKTFEQGTSYIAVLDYYKE